jgi:hypothetical protein
MKRAQVLRRPEGPEKPGTYGKRGIITKKEHTFKKIPELSEKKVVIARFRKSRERKVGFCTKISYYRIVVRRTVHLR